MADGISDEVAAILNQSAGEFEEALERANPVPTNGMYAMCLTKVDARKVTAKDPKKGEFTIVRLSFKVVDDGNYEDYTFGHDFFSGQFPDLCSFASVQAGGHVKADEIGDALAAAINDSTVFHVEVSRDRSSDGKREFINLKAHRIVETA